MRQDGTLYWLLTDHLGSTSVVVNAAGTSVVSEMRYRPWGEIGDQSGAAPTDRLFTGQRYDSDLGLYDYNARWYDPWLGRFIQPDPIVPEPGNPQRLNRYAYANNNPVRYSDPSGHDGIECTVVAGGSTSRSSIISVAHPRSQPLTVSTGSARQNAVIGPAVFRSDDGVFLNYKVPGFLNARTEIAIADVKVDLPVYGGAAYKQVTTTKLWPEGGQESHLEVTISGGVNGGLLRSGGEWSSSDNESALTFGGGPFEAQVSARSIQAMLDLGTAAVGVEAGISHHPMFLTSRGTLEGLGGAEGFGAQFAGSEASLFVRYDFSGGYDASGEWVSGYTRADRLFRRYDVVRRVP